MLKLWKFILLLGLLMMVSCDEDDDADDHDDDHFEAVAWEFNMGGEVLLRVENRVPNGAFNLIVGQETDGIDVIFYDDEGEVETPDEDYTLAWEIDGEGIFEVEQHEGEEGGFEFHLHGESSGTATIGFKVMHGDHSDLSTQPIDVIVTE